MDVLKSFQILGLLTIVSCAKMGYLFEQGIGQYDLLSGSRPNEIYLNDPKTPEGVKDKIQQIEKARDYFNSYWGIEKSKAYTRTTLLERAAVSYLVISSPRSKIQAREHCFWFVGCFPYLGFFSEESAKNFAQKQRQKKLETYVRPVYAYSSLGYFEDPILSSFFIFDEVQLTELVFHELYHLLFFIKNEVELNENLAQFMAQKMVEEYFDLPEGVRARRETKRQKIRHSLVKQTQKLQAIYEDMRANGEDSFRQRREKFFEEDFRPHFRQLCSELSIDQDDCFALRGEWNNARLSAFLTYEKKSEQLSELYERHGKDIKSLQLYIEKKYQQYEKHNSEQSFGEFLVER